MFEAIGQGNDQLMDIEHVIGSSQDDVIIGNGPYNTLECNDTYILDNFGDIVDKGFTGSGGTDWVRSSVSVNLTNMANFQGNIENSCCFRMPVEPEPWVIAGQTVSLETRRAIFFLVGKAMTF